MFPILESIEFSCICYNENTTGSAACFCCKLVQNSVKKCMITLC